MRKLIFLLFLSSCNINPLVNHHQCDWRSVLSDPIMNELMDDTPIASSQVALIYVQYRGLQKRQSYLQQHISNYDELIELTEELVERGVSNTVDLQSLISFQATLQSTMFKLQIELDKLLYNLAPLVKMCPNDLYPLLCHGGPLPVAVRYLVCGAPLDILTYFNDEERVVALTLAEESARKSYQMSQDLFTRGLKSSIDLLIAHKILIGAEDDLIQAQVDLLTDYINLYRRT